MLSDAFGQSTDMASDLDTAWRLAGTKDDGNWAGAFGVKDIALGLKGGERRPGDGWETPLVVIGVEQGELLAAMNDVTAVIDVEGNSIRFLSITSGVTTTFDSLALDK